MASLSVTMPALHPEQARIRREMARFAVVCAGRRFGKSRLGVLLCLQAGLTRGAAWWIAPSYAIASIGWRLLLALSRNIPGAAITKAEKRITYPGGGWVQIKSADTDAGLRGEGLTFACFDECAFIADLESVWNEQVRPALADRKGGAMFISTPKGLNAFHRLWMAAADTPEWSRHYAPSGANPFMPADELETLRATLPERVYRQEILAEFVEDGAYFQRVQERATITAPDLPAQHVNHALYAGLDWAMSEDYTALTVLCLDCGRVVDWDRFNRIDYTYQRERIVSRLMPWGVLGLLPERNSIGQPNIELLRGRVRVLNGHDGAAGFVTTATSKPRLIQALAAALERGDLTVPAEYADELRSYQVDVGAGGNPRFSAPPGQHDDRVISLALAWWAASTSTSWRSVSELGRVEDYQSPWK